METRTQTGAIGTLDPKLQAKYHALKERLQALGSVAIAFSGGVDSTFLSKVAHDVLGDQMIAVTMKSAFVPEADLSGARELAESEGIEHIVVTADILAVPHVAKNPPDRCYWCKSAVFTEIGRVAAERGIAHVADGSNTSDAADYRPGHRAIQELGVMSPLAESGLSKADVRALSHALGLPTWDKPSAACLASRIPYGTRITAGALEQVDAAEGVLAGLGFDHIRVRVHGDIARIEVEPTEIARLAGDDVRGKVARELKALGFRYVTLDLEGYRMGSLNEELQEQAH